MSNKAAWWIVGLTFGSGVLYWLAHSWTVTGVVEAGQPTVSYRQGMGANVPTEGDGQKVPG